LLTALSYEAFSKLECIGAIIGLEQQAMQHEGVIYVAGHPLPNRRCTRLPGCIRLRNDLFCVEWGVKLEFVCSPNI